MDSEALNATDEGFNEIGTEYERETGIKLNDLTTEQKFDIIQQLFSELPTSKLSQLYEKLGSLLHKDFLEVLPVEICFHVFRLLGGRDLVNCARVSRSWKQYVDDPTLWKWLFERNGWTLNRSVVSEFEEWIRIRFSLNSSNSKSNLDETLYSTYMGPRGTHFAPCHCYVRADGSICLNWKYLYQQRLLLQRNWTNGNYVLTRIVCSNRLHMDSVYCVQFDDHFLFTGSRDKTIRVWELQARRLLYVLAGHTGSVLCLQFDKKRNLLVSGSSDTTIIVWDLATLKPLQTFRGHTDNVLGLVFQDDYIISCSKDHTIRVWQYGAADENACLYVLRGHLAAVNSVQFNSKTHMIVSASGDHTIRIWNVKTGQCLGVLHGHRRGIACVHYDGKNIISGSSDLTVRIFDGKTGLLLRSLEGHSELVRTLQCDIEKVVTGSYDGTIKIWDRNSGSLLCDLGNKHGSRIFNLQFDHKRLISCSQDSQILIWDFDLGVDGTFF
ncbi:F-box protein Pof11 [Schizosaccharomyces japonicus yFS275]|uniref:F-box protein Pof11 n=1 Tax=Schizosaccharomyces japonicus (strain yFS275 / FY16936) TaxID=402676 RepID=B6JX97_SCHJY|nr:F-box protein Pof11 [Schizosaccharomyces japonicus yFS275]EEB05998.1 F-box protein Pof11 [Schizosaccharomyces japonicus yFS275]